MAHHSHGLTLLMADLVQTPDWLSPLWLRTQLVKKSANLSFHSGWNAAEKSYSLFLASANPIPQHLEGLSFSCFPWSPEAELPPRVLGLFFLPV